MLVLSRRAGDEIVIGDAIRVKIVAIGDQRVKVGITAPSQVTIHRQEVHQRIQDFHDCPACSEQIANTLGPE